MILESDREIKDKKWVQDMYIEEVKLKVVI